MKERLFSRADWLCGLAAALVAIAVYAWSAAPSVTLLDSGEFIVAAQHFGVPHPTGYPLWTLLAWIFQLVPLGNIAWQLALFSGVCGALAVGLAAMLIRSSALWMLPRLEPAAAGIAAISLSLVFAFSFSMWSQAVIVEVYTLHALLMGLYLTSLYAWIRRPEKLAGLYWSFFTLTLAFSNHQLAIVFAILPLQFLVILLLRRDLFWDLLLALMVCALIAYLAFAMLSNDPVIVRAALRLGYLLLTILAIALFLKRGRLNWRLVAFLPFILALGLLPYLYMPFASATNPPMNWSYARTAEGFFYSFNRSQYPGTLAELSLRIFSKVLGVAPSTPVPAADGSESLVQRIVTWSGFFWSHLIRGFSPLAPLLLIAAIIGITGRTPPGRTWLCILVVAFILAMGLQPVLERATTDNSSWWLQMPYHTYTNFFLAVICGFGACAAWQWIADRKPRWRRAGWALLLLPLWPLWFNVDGASQRNHWLGWKYGRDMLAELPKNSVVFGGTDPGRFITTYMIFGESSLPPSRRIDPSFDRSDLYIITQNGLADRHYLSYIRDHYAAGRPRAATAFERWLGRDTAYPEQPLALPTVAEMQQIRQQVAADARKGSEPLTGKEISDNALAAVARWIFEKNKTNHSFYVEESFAMRWSYPYAVPEGLLYRINPTPLKSLAEEAVRKDFAFWDAYVPALKSDPTYAKDYDARRSFSRLRLTGAEIYAYRKLVPEAENAYRQAFELWPGCVDAVTGLSRLLWPRGEFDEIIALYRRALEDDPNSRGIRQLLAWAEFRKATEAKIDAVRARWQANLEDMGALEELIKLYYQTDQQEQATSTLVEALGKIGAHPEFLRLVVRISEAESNWQQAADAAGRWVQQEPQSAEANYRLARALFALKQTKESRQALETAFRLGGIAMRERLFADPVFQSLKDVPELNQLPAAGAQPEPPEP